MATISRTGWVGATAALLLLGGCADLDRDHGRHGAMHQHMHRDGMKHDGMMGQGMMGNPGAPAAGGHAHGAEAGKPADQHDHAAGTDHGKAAGEKPGGRMGDKPGMMDKCRQKMEAKRDHDHKSGGGTGDRSAGTKPGDDAHAAHKKGDKDGCPMRS